MSKFVHLFRAAPPGTGEQISTKKSAREATELFLLFAP
jgi:hypothetical protein